MPPMGGTVKVTSFTVLAMTVVKATVLEPVRIRGFVMDDEGAEAVTDVIADEEASADGVEDILVGINYTEMSRELQNQIISKRSTLKKRRLGSL